MSYNREMISNGDTWLCPRCEEQNDISNQCKCSLLKEDWEQEVYVCSTCYHDKFMDRGVSVCLDCKDVDSGVSCTYAEWQYAEEYLKEE